MQAGPDPAVGSVSEAESEAVVAYQRYLAEADAAVGGDEAAFDRAQSLAGPLAQIVLENRVDQFEQLREVGLEVAAARIPHVEEATVNEDGSVRIRDCVEERQEEHAGTVRPVRFASQVATARMVEGAWRVEGLIEIDSGIGTDQDPFGCMPKAYRLRLAGFVGPLVAETIELERSADAEWPVELDALVDGNVIDGFVAGIGDAPRDRVVVSPVSAKVVGAVSDGRVNGYEAEVAVCVRYPKGKIWEWSDGEGVVEEPYLPGVDVVVVVTVVSERVVGTEEFTDRVTGFGDPERVACWDVGDDFGEVLSWE